MAILGANYGEVAIPKVTGGYYVNTRSTTPTKYDKKWNPTAYKPAPKPKAPVKTVTAPRVAAAPKPAASIQTVAAPTVAPTPAPAPAAPAQTLDDMINKYYAASQGDVNKLYDNSKTQQLAALKAQQDTATASTKQQYYDKRNQADVVNAQNVQKLRELMASQGIAASGDNLTLNAKANSDRLNSLNTLNTQEQAALNDINNPSKAQAIQNQIETARAQALLNAKQAAYQRAWQQYGFDNMSAAQQAQLAMSKYNLDSTNAANSAAANEALQYYQNAGLGFNSGSGGGGTSASGNAAFNQNLQAAINRGVDPHWGPILTEIIKRESGFNPTAKNPTSTAYGYAQFLNSTRSAYEKKTGLNYNDPVNQIIMMAQYVKDRYGTPQNALNFWNSHQWY